MLEIRNDFDVDLVEHAGSDAVICQAAKVSTLGAASIEAIAAEGLIRFLMSNRHGSPFEHSFLMFRISAPIFVWREFMRHRVGVSYNEQSGRYMQLQPVFYIPPDDRELVQIGKPGHYEFVSGTLEQSSQTWTKLTESYTQSWKTYTDLLELGVAKEVARFSLPVSIYSTAYVTMNTRSLMHFLSLRTKVDGAKFPSFPQWEIWQVANQMEVLFQELFPMTHAAFNAAGRVCP